MPRPSAILFVVCLCAALPPAAVTAAPANGGAIFGTMVHAAYPHYRYAHYNRGHLRPYPGRFQRHHAPRYYQPYGSHHRFQRPRHERYFGLHGYWAPAWRAPNTLRFYRRYH